MGNVQATPSHDDNTDNNDNYVEDDIDKKDNTGQLYPRNARFFVCFLEFKSCTDLQKAAIRAIQERVKVLEFV